MSTRFTVFDARSGESLWGDRPTVFVLRKEARRHLFWFPVEQWRIIGVPEHPDLPYASD